MSRLTRFGPMGLLCLAASMLATPARAAGPAEELLKLVPAEAGATLVVEDLGGHVRAIAESPLVEGLRKLPAFAAWLKNDQHRQFLQARREIEKALAVDLATFGDQILGRAVVLSLQIPPGGGTDRARGLLLLQAKDPELLGRLIERINTLERATGPLERVDERTVEGGGPPYRVRTFRADANRPPDCYALLDDGVFVWSNSEEQIREVLERGQGGGTPGLGSDSRFRAVRERLPDRLVASLFLNPRFLEQVLAEAPAPADAAGESLVALLTGYLKAMIYAGAGLQWREGPVLHVHETLDPTRLQPWQRRWAATGGQVEPLLAKVPADAPAVAAGLFDPVALHEALVGFVPDGDWPKLEHLAIAMRGLLLDRDPRTEVLPGLGPAVLAYVDAPRIGPDDKPRLDLVGVVSLGESADDRLQLSRPLGSALRTLLALVAVDRANRGETLRLVTEGGVTGLLGGQRSIAYGIGRGLVVLGSSMPAVAGFLNAEPASVADSPLRQLRSAYFPEAQSFACVDLQALCRQAEAWRPMIAAAPGDVDQALALLGLFRGAFATNRIDPEFRWVHRTIGLIARDLPSETPISQ